MKVSAREKKILYAGIVIAVAIAIYWVATEFSPDNGESIAEKIETQESLLRRQRELIGREDYYRKRIEDAERDIEKIQARLLPGNNPSTAGTELQRVLNDFAEHAGLVIASKSNMPDRKVVDSDSIIKVSARITLACRDVANCRMEEDMVDFLTAINNYDKFLRIDEMTINTNTQQSRVRIRPQITMVVAGYISVPPPSDPEAKPGENQVTASASTARERR